MDEHRASRIRAALTPKRAELFDLMRARVAQGTWAELAPEDTRGLITIRWECERKVHPAYEIREKTWRELVFVSLVTTTSAPGLGHWPGPCSGRRDSDMTLARALAVVRDPVAALGLAPVPALAWRLAWAPGTDQAGHEPLTWATEAEVLPARYTENIVPGHAARHALDDGLVALDRALNPVTCRYCHSTTIPGRDVLFHPAVAELVEQVPDATQAR